MKTKKAFTLVELSVVLAVGAVVGAVLSMIFVHANNFVSIKTATSARMTDTRNFQTIFDGALEQVQQQEFELVPTPLPSSQINFLTAQPELQNITINFAEKCLWQNTQKLATFTTVKSITFQTDDTLIVCKLHFDENTVCTLTFNKRI